MRFTGCGSLTLVVIVLLGWAARADSLATIGTAEMAANGAIHLHLALPSPLAPEPTLRPIVPWPSREERIGYGEIEIHPWDPHYQEVLRHLGGLAPGQTKPVPPWRDDEAWHCALDPDRGPCPGLHLLPNRIGLR